MSPNTPRSLPPRWPPSTRSRSPSRLCYGKPGTWSSPLVLLRRTSPYARRGRLASSRSLWVVVAHEDPDLFIDELLLPHFCRGTSFCRQTNQTRRSNFRRLESLPRTWLMRCTRPMNLPVFFLGGIKFSPSRILPRTWLRRCTRPTNPSLFFCFFLGGGGGSQPCPSDHPSYLPLLLMSTGPVWPSFTVVRKPAEASGNLYPPYKLLK